MILSFVLVHLRESCFQFECNISAKTEAVQFVSKFVYNTNFVFDVQTNRKFSSSGVQFFSEFVSNYEFWSGYSMFGNLFVLACKLISK